MSFVLECPLAYRWIDVNDENEKSYHHISSTQSTQDCAVRSAPHISKLSVKNVVLSSNFRTKAVHFKFSVRHLGFSALISRERISEHHQHRLPHTILINALSAEQTYAARSPVEPADFLVHTLECELQRHGAGTDTVVMFLAHCFHQPVN